MDKYRYLLALGSNLGDLETNANKALELLNSHGQLLKLSPRIMTDPLPSDLHEVRDHKPFLNFLAEYSSPLDPHALYQVILKIEDSLGHCRTRRWAPRAMDIDILLASINDHADFKNCTPIVLNEAMPGLSIPHKDFYKRDFWQDLLTKLEKI